MNAGVHARGRSGRVTQRCHNSPDWKRGKRVRVTSRTGSERRIWGILKKSVESRTGHRTRRVDFRGSQRPDEFARYGRHTCWGADGKSQNRKNVYLSSLCRNLKLKGNKRFRTWTKKSLRVFVFRDSCSMYICYEHSMYVSHISVSSVWYIHIDCYRSWAMMVRSF